MIQIPLLSLIIWLPVLGSILVLIFGNHTHPNRARIIALTFSVIVALLCIPLYLGFDTSTYNMQFSEHFDWIPAYGIHYDLGVDGISLPLVILTCYTTLLVVLASWQTIHEKIPQYLA